MKRIFFITLAALVVGAGIFLGTNLYLNRMEKENQRLDRAQSWDVFFDGQKLLPFTDLRPELLGNRTKKFLGMNLRDKLDTLLTCKFSTLTAWPAQEKLPPDFHPQAIIEEGKDPGLGIRELHRQGITGKGIHVAIQDYSINKGHVEYREQLVQLKLTDGRDPASDARTSMHGPAVASLLVGRDCGVAPGASLHFWANPLPAPDYQPSITAVEQVLEANRGQSRSAQIRIFSLSMNLNPRFKNYQKWVDTLKKAKSSGLIVIHCGIGMMGAGCPLGKDRNDPANYRICYFAQTDADHMPANIIYIPIDNRTLADRNGVNDYYFTTRSGLSWGAPYLAGLMALGLQINPDLNEGDLYRLIRETGTPFNRGRLVNPGSFIQRIKQDYKK